MFGLVRDSQCLERDWFAERFGGGHRLVGVGDGPAGRNRNAGRRKQGFRRGLVEQLRLVCNGAVRHERLRGRGKPGRPDGSGAFDGRQRFA